MPENSTRDRNSKLSAGSPSGFTFGERWRLVFLFLVINVLIFMLLWLFWQNQMLVQRIGVLETRVVNQIATCEADCTDKMSTVAVKFGTEMAQTASVPGEVGTAPSVSDAATATSVPPTFTYPPTPSLAPTVTPQLSPTPAESPTPFSPTFTPTPLTPTPSQPPTSPPPDTPEPPSSRPLPPPVVSGMSPSMTVKRSGPPLTVTITGQHFVSPVTARLGVDFSITVSTNTATVITGTLSPNMPVGVYGLTVTNPDGQRGTYPPAFIVRTDATSFESPYLATYGSDAGAPYDESGYQEQVIFFDVPAGSPVSELYIRVFDADIGGDSKCDHKLGDSDDWDTQVRYTVYGLAGTYTLSQARIVPPTGAGITSGTPLTTATLGDAGLEKTWDFCLGPFRLDQGELVDGRRVFKLVVEGLDGDDGNWYRVALSESQNENTVPSDARMFAFSWTLLVHDVDLPRLHPYVGTGLETFRLQSFGCDCEGEPIGIRTPFREIEAICSGGGTFVRRGSDACHVDVEDEYGDGVAWTVDFGEYSFLDFDVIGLWVEGIGQDQIPRTLPVFTQPTNKLLP